MAQEHHHIFDHTNAFWHAFIWNRDSSWPETLTLVRVWAMVWTCIIIPAWPERVQKSDAGVGIGTLVGDKDSLARKYRNWFVFTHNRFMFFDRNEIHIQAFGEIPPAKWMSGDSSSSTFHHFQEFIIFNYQKFRNSKFQSFKDSKTPWIQRR